MKTKLITIEGVELVVRDGYTPKYNKLDDFPSSCGPGNGFFERLVPEKILGLKISASCDIHDDCFKHGDATWADFHQSNSMFIRNNMAIIMSKSLSGMNFLRIVVAAFYFHAVDEIGAKIYTAIQLAKGQEMK